MKRPHTMVIHENTFHDQISQSLFTRCTHFIREKFSCTRDVTKFYFSGALVRNPNENIENGYCICCWAVLKTVTKMPKAKMSNYMNAITIHWCVSLAIKKDCADTRLEQNCHTSRLINNIKIYFNLLLFFSEKKKWEKNRFEKLAFQCLQIV